MSQLIDIQKEVIKKDNNLYLLYNSNEYYLCKENDINIYYLDYMIDILIDSINREERMKEWN